MSWFFFYKNDNNLCQDIKRTIVRPFLYHFRPMCTYYWPYQWHIRNSTRGWWVIGWVGGDNFWIELAGWHITRWSESDHWSSAVRCCSTPLGLWRLLSGLRTTESGERGLGANWECRRVLVQTENVFIFINQSSGIWHSSHSCSHSAQFNSQRQCLPLFRPYPRRPLGCRLVAKFQLQVQQTKCIKSTFQPHKWTFPYLVVASSIQHPESVSLSSTAKVFHHLFYLHDKKKVDNSEINE